MLTRNFDQLSKEVKHHVKCDAIRQGSYWDGSRGCFIGCLAHSGDTAKVQDTYGLPIMLQRIAENIFESLPLNEAQAFFAALPTAVGCDNKDLSKVGWQFLASELRSLPPQPAEIAAVIEFVLPLPTLSPAPTTPTLLPMLLPTLPALLPLLLLLLLMLLLPTLSPTPACVSVTCF